MNGISDKLIYFGLLFSSSSMIADWQKKKHKLKYNPIKNSICYMHVNSYVGKSLLISTKRKNLFMEEKENGFSLFFYKLGK